MRSAYRSLPFQRFNSAVQGILKIFSLIRELSDQGLAHLLHIFIFTNDHGRLAEALSRDVSHESAHKAEKAVSPGQQDVAHSPQPARARGLEVGIGV